MDRSWKYRPLDPTAAHHHQVVIIHGPRNLHYATMHVCLYAPSALSGSIAVLSIIVICSCYRLQSSTLKVDYSHGIHFPPCATTHLPPLRQRLLRLLNQPSDRTRGRHTFPSCPFRYPRLVHVLPRPARQRPLPRRLPRLIRRLGGASPRRPGEGRRRCSARLLLMYRDDIRLGHAGVSDHTQHDAFQEIKTYHQIAYTSTTFPAPSSPATKSHSGSSTRSHTPPVYSS